MGYNTGRRKLALQKAHSSGRSLCDLPLRSLACSGSGSAQK